jgi:hypothetical protein
MKVLAKYINPNGIKNKNTAKLLNPTGIKKYEVLIIDTQIVLNRKTIPDQHWRLPKPTPRNLAV